MILSFVVQRIAGYNENACEQPWTVALTLKLLVAVPPILIILTSLIFLHFYPITEETRMRTKRLLAERRFVTKNIAITVSYTYGCITTSYSKS